MEPAKKTWQAAMFALCLTLTSWAPWVTAQQAGSTQALKQLLTADMSRGTFVQTKHLHDMPFPLESRGQFTFNNTHGLHWTIETPIQSQLHITRQGISQIENDREVMRLDQAQHPAIALVSQIFFAVFAGDWSQLNEHFVIKEELQEASTSTWSLSLTPKSALLQQVTPQIDIRGQQYIQQLTIFEASGDKTHIAFYPLNLKADH
jgi:hypothetical protein